MSRWVFKPISSERKFHEDSKNIGYIVQLEPTHPEKASYSLLYPGLSSCKKIGLLQSWTAAAKENPRSGAGFPPIDFVE